MKIVLAGDLFPGGDALSKSAKIDSTIWNKSDIRIANLECPLSDNADEADKSTLYAPSSGVETLEKIQLDIVGLANNHIHDKNEEGLFNTIKTLGDHGIEWVGAGIDIIKARTPIELTDKLFLLAYCDYGKSYLNKVAISNDVNAGVAPLRIEIILDDLSKLSKDSNAILMFHWGREHMWFPPSQDIILAKELLKHDKVVLIVGNHAHRIQGIISHGPKKAFMCVGNFLFPNFYILPPTKIVYPNSISNNYKTDVTRRYHRVLRLTYKKWKLINRLSLIIRYDSKDSKTSYHPMYQADDIPSIKELTGISVKLIEVFINLLSVVYKLPTPIYKIFATTNDFIYNYIRYSKNILFRTRQKILIMFNGIIK